MFLKILSYLDHVVEWNQFLNDRKNDFEETEKILHEAQAFREQYKKITIQIHMMRMFFKN